MKRALLEFVLGLIFLFLMMFALIPITALFIVYYIRKMGRKVIDHTQAAHK